MMKETTMYTFETVMERLHREQVERKAKADREAKKRKRRDRLALIGWSLVGAVVLVIIAHQMPLILDQWYHQQYKTPEQWR